MWLDEPFIYPNQATNQICYSQFRQANKSQDFLLVWGAALVARVHHLVQESNWTFAAVLCSCFIVKIQSAVNKATTTAASMIIALARLAVLRRL